jgi:hypothetical protein
MLLVPRSAFILSETFPETFHMKTGRISLTLYPAVFFEHRVVESELLVQLQVHVQQVALAYEPVMLPAISLVMDFQPRRGILHQVSML